MSFFLDTNICSYFLKGTYPALKEHLQDRKPASISIPAIVRAELYFGAEKSNRPEETRNTIEQFLLPFEVVPFDQEASAHYASIRSTLEGSGDPIGPNDLIIASTVRSRNGTLVTANTREFQRVQDLPIADWTSSRDESRE